jgi:AraC family transcriptional regulator
MAEWKVKRVVDYIEQNLDQDIGLEELSSNVDMTPDYLCRAFRKAVGMPPYRCLLGRRIERAKELLRSTDRSLTDIALEVGFSSHSHFTSAFRAAVGYTPANYRKSHPALDP